MTYLLCRCGSQSKVLPTMAGSTIQCPQCHRQLAVPRLSVLQRYATRGEPVPPAEVELAAPDPQDQDRSFFMPLCGTIGTTGGVSSSSMENYVGVLTLLIDRFLGDLGPATGLELMASCALMPEGKKLIVVEASPADVGGRLHALQAALEQTPAPPVVGGPVAFVLYRGVNLVTGHGVRVQPFGPYQQRIAADGIEAALMQAVGLKLAPAAQEPPRPTWWQRIVRFLRGAPAASPAAEDSKIAAHQEMRDWLFDLEYRSAKLPIDALQQFEQEMHELAFHAALAARYCELEEWPRAIEQYAAAISLEPCFAPLYSRRARAYLAEGNRPAALADLNKAIELAPWEPWYCYHRSAIFADLEAWPQALADLDSSVRLAPREPVFLSARASIRLFREDYAAALTDLRAIVELDPNSGPAHLQLSWMYPRAEFGDVNVALEHATRAAELMPTALEPRIRRSLLYGSQGKFELALDDCRTVIEQQPEEAGGYAVRGQILYLQGQFAEAIEACGQALDRNPEIAAALVYRGLAYAATDQPELALADCDAALAIEPDCALAFHLRGVLCLHRGELDKALEALSKAREIAPNWAEPREQIALLHRISENPQAAVEEQSILVAQQPGNPAHLVNRAFAYAQLGDFDAAERDFDRACELDPENERILFLRGCFHMDRQNATAALRDLDRVLELADDHDDARMRRVTILLRFKRNAEALHDLGKLIARHPEDPRFYSGRALAHQIIGDERAAEADLEQVVRMAPESSEEMSINSLVAKIHRLEREERYDEALLAAEEIIQLAPSEPIGYRQRAWIRWYSEQLVEAVEDYNRLLEQSPDDPGLLNCRGHLQAEMGEFRAALDDLDASIEGSRKSGETAVLAYALNGRALALSGVGREEDAERDFEESIRLCPGNSWAYYNRGIAVYRLGDAGEARRLMELALSVSDPPLTKRKRERARALLERLLVPPMDAPAGCERQ